jgi:hypothetical protein
MKTSIIASLVAAAALLPTLAHAQDTAISSASSDSTVFVGGNLQMLPVGTWDVSANGQDTSGDTAAAFAIGALAEVRVNPIFSVGLAPRYIFNVKGANDTQSASQLDLAVRFAAGTDVAPKARLYGFVAPGYSWMFTPSNGMTDVANPSGLIVGFGGGASYEIAPKIALTGELGYQLGFQSFDVNGTNVGSKDNYLQLGIGLVAALN